MADWGGLENRCACKRTVGSNPTPSARDYREFSLPLFVLALLPLKTPVFLGFL